MSNSDVLFLVMKTIWVMISGVTLAFLAHYFYTSSKAGETLFKKPFKWSFSVGLTAIYLVIFIKQLIGYFQTGSVYLIYIAVGFLLLMVYMGLQSMNEFLIFDQGMTYNLKYTKWEDVADYQIANKDNSKVFKIIVNKKNIVQKPVQKSYIISVTVDQGEEVSRLLKEKVSL